MSQRDAVSALVICNFVADPFADGLAVEIKRQVGVDEVETGFGAGGGGGGGGAGRGGGGRGASRSLATTRPGGRIGRISHLSVNGFEGGGTCSGDGAPQGACD